MRAALAFAGFLSLAAPSRAFAQPAPPIVDTDADGIPDPVPGFPRPACRADRLADCWDNCPVKKNPNQDDDDGDGRGNACDTCPEKADPDQADADADGIGDACDTCPLPNPRDPETRAPGPCPEGPKFTRWKDPDPLGRRLQFFLRPLGVVYRYRDTWGRSTGLGVHAAGSLGSWAFDETGTATQVPSWFWSLGGYADAINVFDAEHVGPYLGLDWRPMGWPAYAQSFARNFKWGVQAHLLWSKRLNGPAHRPLHLGLGPKIGFLDILSLMPIFAQIDVANGNALSWGGFLVLDFKILRELGVPAPK